MRIIGIVLVLAIVFGGPIGYRYIAVEDYSSSPLPIARDSCDLIRPLRSKAQVLARLGRQPDHKGKSHYLLHDEKLGKYGRDLETWTWDENGRSITVFFNRNGTVWDCHFSVPKKPLRDEEIKEFEENCWVPKNPASSPNNVN